MIVSIWHGKKHDDCTVTEFELHPEDSFPSFVYEAFKSGGVFLGGAFVPWHKINYIEKAA